MLKPPWNIDKLQNRQSIHLKLHRMIFECAARDLNIIKGHGVVGKLLIILVTFACDQHNVARLRQLDRAPDRRCTIDNFLVTIGAKSFFNLRDDRVWIFFAWIV